MANPSLCKALKRAERAGPGWEQLSHAASWNQHMLAKNRLTEAQALEEVLSAVPNDAQSQLVKASLQESTNLIMELDDLIQAAEEMAEVMRRIAPWDRTDHP
jgi:hypothetical protein